MSEKSYIPSGVFLVCDKGVIPTPLTAMAAPTVDFLGTIVATDRDKIPMVNIKPFGVCAVTHVPCVPAPLPLGWRPVREDVEIMGGHPLLEDSQLRCTAGGCISVFMSMSAALLGVAGNANAAVNAAVDGVIKDVEDGVKHQFDNANDYLKQLGPPFADMAREQLGEVEGAWEGVSGIATGLWELSKMARNLELKAANAVVHAIDHPAETAEALKQGAQRGWTAAQDSKTWLSAADMASNAVPGVLQVKAAVWLSDPAHREQAWKVTKAAYAKANTFMADPRNRGRFKGRVLFEVAFALLTAGAGEAANAGKIGEVVNAGEKLAEAAELGKSALPMGKVITGAEEVAAEVAAKGSGKVAGEQAAKELETVGGACKGSRTCKAEPVDVATGDMIFDAVDVELPGPVPLVWERTWYSTSQRNGSLGHGWHHCYDLALWTDSEGGVHLRQADGRLATFAPLSAENDFRAYHQAERLELRRAATGAGYAVYAIRERLTYHFAPGADPDQKHAAFQQLLRIEDGHGHAVRFAYSAQGHLGGITDSAGRAIGVRTDAAGRILALDLPRPDGAPGTFPAVQYAYDAAGNMTAVTDAEGHTMRFAYRGHLLTTRTFRTGIRFYFEYDAQNRCVHTWGDGNCLNYRFAYEPGHTVVVTEDPAARQEYYHTAGLVTHHVDGVGNVREWEYNPNGELQVSRDPLGHATSYDYDARGNLAGVTYPDGARVQTAHENDLPVAFTDALGNEWRWAYDAAGNQVQRIDPAGLVTTSTYEEGLLRTTAAGDGPPTTLHYDAQLNLREVRLPDGQRRSWEHDALGRVVALTDARGNTQRRAYDLCGQLRQVEEPDGNVRWLTYDGEGNVRRAHDSYQDVTLAYTGLNWLASRAQAGTQAGTQVRYDYNADGDLTRITNEEGRRHEFTLDAAGQIVAETRFDGQLRRFARDAAGQVLTQWAGASTQPTHYAYDPAGRVTAVTYPDGSQETFAYRLDGTLAEARNAELAVAWERDSLGRVLRETQGAHAVSSRYDRAGQRIGLASSLGAAVALERDDYGDVAHVRTADWQAHFERDAQGLEVARTLSGGVQARWQRDQLGRPVAQQLMAGARQRRRHYRWQGPDQLAELTDSAAGTTRFTYDARGALATALHPDGTEELRLPDAVGNLFAAPDRQDREYGPGGQLRQAGGARYRYDELGQRTHKTLPDGRQWRYAWNGAGQLAGVTRPDGYAVTFAYDALGRRVRKRFRGKVTHWVWDGNAPLHEWHELEVGPGAGAVADLTTWLFEEGSAAPLAKLTATGSYGVVCDHLGTPLELYDGQGKATWQMALDAYGGVRQGQGKAQDCPFRYQGQYEDVETGLYYNRFRYYDPAVGAYISQDPIGLAGGLAAYAYVDDPHKQVDVFGLSGTCPLAGARQSNPWNEFQRRAKGGQFKDSREAAKAYRHFQNGEFREMAELMDLSSPHGKAVFWSGDLPEAQRYADAIKGTTMESTPGGRIFDKWDYLKERYPEWDTNPNSALNQKELWKAVSGKYASEATGPVHYVHKYEGNIWTTVEKPALITQGNPINYIKIP